MNTVSVLRQTQRNWVSSPIVINQLMTIIKGNGTANKYMQIRDSLQKKSDFQNETLQLTNVERKHPTMFNIKNMRFQHSAEAITILNDWVKEKGCNHQVARELLICDQKWILANVCSYRGRWKMDKMAKMKVYNSFNYSEDVRYEARLLEYALHDEDFKLVVVVPNEPDVMGQLIDTLRFDGLKAAICKTQPSFTSESVAIPLDVHFSSKVQSRETENKITMFEFGDVKIDEKGISVTVCTGTSGKDVTPAMIVRAGDTREYFFTIIFKDVAIFTGQYTREIIE